MVQSQYTNKDLGIGEKVGMNAHANRSLSEQDVKRLSTELNAITKIIANREEAVSSIIFHKPDDNESFEVHKKILSSNWTVITKMITRKSEIVGILHKSGWVSNEEWEKYILSDDSSYIPKIEW